MNDEIKRAIETVRANEWSGRERVIFHNVVDAGRSLAFATELLTERLDRIQRLAESHNNCASNVGAHHLAARIVGICEGNADQPAGADVWPDPDPPDDAELHRRKAAYLGRLLIEPGGRNE
tara:strand:- start:34 stop:396 length:363 start_codon:yes stop_codon:yes gene_type:complete